MKITHYFKKYSFVIGIIILLIILSKSDVEKIYQYIKINPFYLISALLIMFLMLLTKALCWNYIKRQQDIKYNLKNSFLMHCAGSYIGILTPGRIGEIAKALYLKKDGYSLGKSLVSVILDRLSDFVFLITFICLGSLFFLTIFQKEIFILILGIIIFTILLIISSKLGLIKWFFNKLFEILVPKKYQKSWKINFQDFVRDIKIYNPKNYLIIFLITAFSWFFYYLQIYILAKGLSINLPFLYLAISVTISGLITLIPISFSGIGTRDAALIFLFTPFAIPKEQVIAFSALILFIYLSSALVGLICWLIKPIKI